MYFFFNSVVIRVHLFFIVSLFVRVRIEWQREEMREKEREKERERASLGFYFLHILSMKTTTFITIRKHFIFCLVPTAPRIVSACSLCGSFKYIAITLYYTHLQNINSWSVRISHATVKHVHFIYFFRPFTHLISACATLLCVFFFYQSCLL